MSTNSGCCRKTQGIFSVRNWSICTLVTGGLFIMLGIGLPHHISRLIDSKLCDQVCIPRSTDDSTTKNNWLTNANTDMNPIELYDFYVYNITNSDNMWINNGAYPNVTVVGPYVYQLYREKFNVSWSADESEIAYEYREKYTFVPEKSIDRTTNRQLNNTADVIFSVNIPALASWYLIQTSELWGFWPLDLKLQAMQITNDQCKTNQEKNKIEEGVYAGCLFAKRPAHDVMFYQPSPLVEQANTSFFTDDESITELTPIFNHETNEDTAQAMRFNHNFGLGGTYKPRIAYVTFHGIKTPFILRHQGASPGNDSDVRIRQLTGHGSLSDVSLTTTYLGNTTFEFWANPVHVTGHDSYQVKPYLDESDRLEIFDGQVYRNVRLDYQGKTSLLDVDMNRYYATNIFDGNDPTYDGPNITGLFNATRLATTRFGVPTPLYISRPYLAGVDPTHEWVRNITCTNCPDMKQGWNPEDYNIIVDIEPTLGKVLRGKKRVQTNVLLGDPHIFNPSDTKDQNMWAKVPESFVPIFWFEYGAEMDQNQADKVKNGLSLIHLGRAFESILLFGGTIGGSLLVISAYLLYKHHQRLLKQQTEYVNEHEPMMNVAGPADEPYTSTHPYTQH